MRKGISYTMTLAVVAVVLVIGGVTVTTFFTGSVDSVSDILTGQNTASERNLCEQRVSRFCGSNPDGTSWAAQFPECTSYSGQIDDDGDTSCPLGGEPSDTTEDTDSSEDESPDSCADAGGTCTSTGSCSSIGGSEIPGTEEFCSSGEVCCG